MIDPQETFDGTWPFAPNFYDGNGFRKHYVDEGEGNPRLLVDHLDLTRVLASIPAIGIFGEEDRAIPTGYAIASFKGMYPDGPVVRLPGVGHFLQEDAPEAVASMVELFIQSS